MSACFDSRAVARFRRSDVVDETTDGGVGESRDVGISSEPNRSQKRSENVECEDDDDDAAF